MNLELTPEQEVQKWIALAADENTSTDVLLKLEKLGSLKVKQALAVNPNSPIELLLRLSKEFPEEVLHNPVLPLAFLENLEVDIFVNFPKSFLLGLVNNSQTPQEILGMLLLSKVYSISKSAKLHVNWAGEMSQGWHENALEFIHNIPIEEPDLKYLDELARCGLIPEKALPYIPANQQGEKLLKAIARTTKTPQNVLKELFDSGKCYHELALNPNTPLLILEQLFKSGDDNVRSILARNPRFPQSLLEELFRLGKSYSEYSQLAVNPNTPPVILEQLLKSSDDNVRSVLSQNPDAASIEILIASNINIPESLLKQLAKNNNSLVRKNVAKNLSTPANILKDLARDDDEEVRLEVTQNPSTPINILLEAIASISRSLLHNIDNRLAHSYRSKFATPFVTWEAAANPHIPTSFLEQWVKSGDVRFLIPVAKNPNTPVSTLLKLARDENPLVRYAVAQNSNLSVNILEELAKDKEVEIRSKIVIHPNTPVTLLEELAKDKKVYWEVCWELAANPNTPISILEQCLDEVINECYGLKISAVEAYLERNPSGLPTLLEKSLNHAEAIFSLSRFFLLLNPATPATTLVINSYSTAWLERYAVAQHSNTPIETLNILANDVNCIVRATAKDILKCR